MKKIFGLALATVALATSCKEEFEQPKNYSSFAVIQASPTSATAPTDTVNVYVGTAKYTSSPLTYLTSSFGPYLPVLSGSHTINIRRKTADSSLYVNNFDYNFEPAGIYSFFVYDTTTSATGQAKVLKLKDDLTLPATTNSKVRFLHLAPTAPAVDITLLRTSVTPNDSVTISNKAYIGATPDETALAAFTSVPRGVYTAKVKAAGTQTVITTLAADMSRGTDVTQGGIFTIYATGTAKGRPLAVRLFRNY
ncbi:MAG: DUF4397 domain-containing protein [Chitinophagaceae bacterium]|nr:MAG: DUF4397 domain-containing protein [Chitinophagaceae bacterium]